MKIQKLNEDMPNLDKVVHNDDLNAVTEMPPTMSDAYIDSVEADKAVEDIIKPAEEIIKEKPFLGAQKQPVPKEPEEAKITLDESLFDDDSPLTDPSDGNYSLQEQIFDFLDHSDSFDTAEMVELVSDEFGMSPDEADRYVQDWITNSEAEWHDTVDQEKEDISIDSLKDYVDSVEVEEDEDFDESLNEDGRSQSLLRQLDDTDIDEEEFDLWTLVYSSLINKPDEATWKAMQKYDTVILPKKLRYDTINSDSDGNIIVYGKTEKDLDGAKLVADLYELEYEVKPSRASWAKQHPEQSFSLTIKIPEEEITDIDKYFKKDE